MLTFKHGRDFSFLSSSKRSQFKQSLGSPNWTCTILTVWQVDESTNNRRVQKSEVIKPKKTQFVKLVRNIINISKKATALEVHVQLVLLAAVLGGEQLAASLAWTLVRRDFFRGLINASNRSASCQILLIIIVDLVDSWIFWLLLSQFNTNSETELDSNRQFLVPWPKCKQFLHWVTYGRLYR